MAGWFACGRCMPRLWLKPNQMDEQAYKIWMGAAAIALTFAAFVPYIRSILDGATRPHVFSWIVWGTNTCVAFYATLHAQGGAGAWAVGFSGAITLLVAVLAYAKRADITITRTDWLFLISGLAALPLWFMASNPLWAIVIVTAIELLGFGPTVRKSWHQPYSEPMSFLGILILRNALVIAALEQYSAATLLFPAAMAAACLALIAMMAWRRQTIVMDGTHTKPCREAS